MVDVTRRKKWDEIEHMGQRIRHAREHLSMTQEELAERIGRSRVTISHYEIGDRAIVVTELLLLAQALRVPIGYFFGQDDPDDEALSLILELKEMTPVQKKAILERWRFELDWWKKQSMAQIEIAQD